PPPSSPVLLGFRTDCQARSRASFRLTLLLTEYPLLSRHPPNYRLNGTLREARRSHTRDAPFPALWPEKYAASPHRRCTFSASVRRTTPAIYVNLQRGKWLR